MNLMPWMYDNKKDIRDWLRRANIGCQINDDLEIEAADTNINLTVSLALKRRLLVEHENEIYLPVQFHSSNDFGISGLTLSSLHGCPRHVHGVFACQKTSIHSFDGAPETIDFTLNGSSVSKLSNFSGLENTNIQTMTFTSNGFVPHMIDNITGLPKSLTDLHLGGVRSLSGLHKVCPNLTKISLGAYITSGLLSILMLKKLKIINYDPFMSDRSLVKALEIITKYKWGNNDILECQEELISAGYKEYARL